MLNDATGFKKIYLATGYTDLRRGIDGLATMIRFRFHLDPCDKNTLFLFCGKAIIYSIAETAKANNLKPYECFEYLLTEIPKYMDDINRAFLDDLLPWSEKLPDNIRKPKK